MIRLKKRIRRIIRENTGSLSREDHGAMQFMTQYLGDNPAGDELQGLHSQISDFAAMHNLDSGELMNSLHKMMPSKSSDRPHYQQDPASGAVGSVSGQKVYGENMMRVTRRQLRRIIRETFLVELNEANTLHRS